MKRSKTIVFAIAAFAVSALLSGCATFFVSGGALAHSLPAGGKVLDAQVGLLPNTEADGTFGFQSSAYYGIALGENFEIGFQPSYVLGATQATILGSTSTTNYWSGSLFVPLKWDPIPDGRVFHIIPFLGPDLFGYQIEGSDIQFIVLPVFGLDLLLNFDRVDVYAAAAMPLIPQATTFSAGARFRLFGNFRLGVEAGLNLPFFPYVAVNGSIVM